MKKILALVLSLVLVFSAACAETADSLFETLSGLEWTFASGVGAWSTDLRIRADGSFSGEFHDSEMGDSAEDYPDGTVYFCSFSGRMSLVGQVDENTWKIRVDELVSGEEQPKESVSDGIRYVSADAYGLSEGDVMLLYRPGTPVSVLSEDMQLWAHVLDQEDTLHELPDWFLSSEANDSGFVGYQAQFTSANPWEEMTAEQLGDITGLYFGVPEGAESVVIRYLRSENLSEMQFSRDGEEYCVRIQPVMLQDGEYPDISGLYYDWEQEEPVVIRFCPGTIRQAHTGDGTWIESCLWYDEIPGLMYSLSVVSDDIDGLDLTAVAEQDFIPIMGDV